MHLFAQSDAAPAGVLDILFAGGWTGLLILFVLVGLSLLAVALVVEHLTAVRREKLAPGELASELQKALAAGDLPKAASACDQRPTVLASVVRPALGEAEVSWAAVEKTAEEALAEQAARLYRRIEYLSVIGNIAPMLGLLGTVIGMILAFQQVAETQGAARAPQLAEGIYQALVTTVGGLLVAIPSLAAYAVLRNRLDGLIAETAGVAARTLRPLKRALTTR